MIDSPDPHDQELVDDLERASVAHAERRRALLGLRKHYAEELRRPTPAGLGEQPRRRHFLFETLRALWRASR